MTTVNEEEVSSLHRNLRYREDAVERPDDMSGPSFNMRTWAASNRRAGTTSGNAVKRMQKWDTSYVEEVVEEKSFLNNGISVLLDSRREPTKAKSSKKMRESIRRFRPGGEANKTVLLALEKDAHEAVYPSALPFETVHAPSRTFLEGDVLVPLRHAEAEEASSEALGVSAEAYRQFAPAATSRATTTPNLPSLVSSTVRGSDGKPLDFIPRSSVSVSAHMQGQPSPASPPPPTLQSGPASPNSTSVTMADAALQATRPASVPLRSPMGSPVLSQSQQLADLEQFPTITTVGGRRLKPLEYEAARDVELPPYQSVNYEELYREQEIVDHDRAEQEGIYKGLVEDLDDHMESVKETFQAMLVGQFVLKRERRKKDAPTILPTEEDFGAPSGKRLSFVLASNPSFHHQPDAVSSSPQ